MTGRAAQLRQRHTAHFRTSVHEKEHERRKVVGILCDAPAAPLPFAARSHTCLDDIQQIRQAQFPSRKNPELRQGLVAQLMPSLMRPLAAS